MGSGRRTTPPGKTTAPAEAAAARTTLGPLGGNDLLAVAVLSLGEGLTVADICADLAISRRTFYEWRAKGKAPECIVLPNGELRVTVPE